VIDSW